MDFIYIFVAIGALIAAVLSWQSKKKAVELSDELIRINKALLSRIAEIGDRLSKLEPYQNIIDAKSSALKIIAEANNTLIQAKEDANKIANDILSEANNTLSEANNSLTQAKYYADQQRREAHETAKEKIQQADEQIKIASDESARIIADAKKRAEEIAGDAYTAMSRAKEFSETALAMKNIIEGYGDHYLVPTYSLLDELADEFGYTEAGAALKKSRETSRAMVRTGRSATCDYAETNRRETAIRFVTDAFNGKVDSILSRGKADNHGKLEQEIRDAFALVNHNGEAFRKARITEEYLSARMEELKWSATARALKDEEREEQRRIRDQMREEEKARKEYERAMTEAAKEEESIRKAMDKVQQQVASANEAQRAEFEAKLRDLEEKLQAAEDKNQRAQSMAQQTRTGHVYVISNIGSFGDDVFKIGMTRRLEPKDRIRELGDASVPFEFDIHAMIHSEDAPTLEKSLHRHFMRQQMNKVNPRKEFFKLSLADIKSEVEGLGIAAHWTMAAAALAHRETLRIEQQIAENPVIEKEWTRFQMQYSPENSEDEQVITETAVR